MIKPLKYYIIIINKITYVDNLKKNKLKKKLQ